MSTDWDPKELLGKNLIKYPFFEKANTHGSDGDAFAWEQWAPNGEELLIIDDDTLVENGKSLILNGNSNVYKAGILFTKQVPNDHVLYTKFYAEYVINFPELYTSTSVQGVVQRNGSGAKTITFTKNTAKTPNVSGHLFSVSYRSIPAYETDIYSYNMYLATSSAKSDPESNYWKILGVFFIDLTDIFGEGNEPTLEWCDENVNSENLYKIETVHGKNAYPKDSILVEIKKLRGIEPNDKSFDTDIIDHINTAMFFLKQLEVGPENGYRINGYEETWSDFWGKYKPVESVKDYIDLRVSLLFDPPSSGVLHEAKERMIKELEYRLNVECDTWPYYTKSGGDADEPEDNDADINWGD